MFVKVITRIFFSTIITLRSLIIMMKLVHLNSIVEAVDEHRGVRGEGGGGFTLNPPWQISKDLFKNAIKPRIGGSPGNFS
jgi:hypothetical protein